MALSLSAQPMTDGDMNQMIRSYKSLYGENSHEVAQCVLWCAHMCCEGGDYKQAKGLLEQSKDIFDVYGKGEFKGLDSLSYIFSLDLESRIESASDRSLVALNLSKKSCELKREYFGRDSNQYLLSLLAVSKLYAERKKNRRSNEFHNMGYTSYVEQIKSEFCAVSESGRSLYWTKAANYIYKTMQLAHTMSRQASLGAEASLSSAAYNSMLLSKSLLLNCSLNFEEFVVGSNNKKANSLLEACKIYKETTGNQNIVDSLELEILQVLKKSGQDFTLPQLSITWKDVANRLSKDDIAIEFYKVENNKYGAVLLRREWKTPRIVRLKEYVKVGDKYVSLDKALSTLSMEAYSATNADSFWNLSKAVWCDDIVKYFPKTKSGRIYFSAEGQLYNVPLCLDRG